MCVPEVETHNTNPALRTFKSFKSTLLPSPTLQVNLAQLLPSVYAARYPRTFLENVSGVYHTVLSALFIESVGVLHATFAIVDAAEYIIHRHTVSVIEEGNLRG